MLCLQALSTSLSCCALKYFQSFSVCQENHILFAHLTSHLWVFSSALSSLCSGRCCVYIFPFLWLMCQLHKVIRALPASSQDVKYIWENRGSKLSGTEGNIFHDRCKCPSKKQEWEAKRTSGRWLPVGGEMYGKVSFYL